MPASREHCRLRPPNMPFIYSRHLPIVLFPRSNTPSPEEKQTLEIKDRGPEWLLRRGTRSLPPSLRPRQSPFSSRQGAVVRGRRAATAITRGQKEIFPRHGPVEQRCSRTVGHMGLEFNKKGSAMQLASHV